MAVGLVSALLPLFLPRTLASPYPFPNSTYGTNTTLCNATYPAYLNGTDCNTTLVPLPLPPMVEYKCVTTYPTDLAIMNARYPDYNTTHLHDTNRLFMLRRQRDSDGEIATRVQFQNLPSSDTNTTCRLEIVFPKPEMQIIQGFNPSFNVYQVPREAGTVPTWKSYDPDDAELVGMVNGEPEALALTAKAGGIAAISEVPCNETLTFQMGMVYNSMDVPNYWEFINVVPPAAPVQGFRVVYGC